MFSDGVMIPTGVGPGVGMAALLDLNDVILSNICELAIM